MELISTHVCKSSDIGMNENMFGGKMLSLIDESAGAFAAQICDTPRMVTVKMDECSFRHTVRIGNLIKIYGKIHSIGNASITLHVEARRHSVYTGDQKTVVSTFIKFCRIDEDGNPIPISERVKKKYGFN
jgi:acyl-CoA thioesterase YciA